MKEYTFYQDLLKKRMNEQLSIWKEKKHHLVFEDLVYKQIENFSFAGKAIRGSFCLRSGELFSIPTEKSIDLACGFEWIQNALLVHDDFMDQDSQRRGQETIHVQYENFLKEQKIENTHIAESLSVCVGDFFFFLAMDSLYKKDYPKDLIHLLSRVFSTVILGQMQDIYLETKDHISLDDILTTYEYKTARYTFSLPLVSGAFLANESDIIKDALFQIGVQMGIFFQIQDDFLNLYGVKNEKSHFSDLYNHKKSLFYYFLQLHKAKLPKAYFTNETLSKKDIKDILNVIQEEKIDKDVSTLLIKREKKVLSLINHLPTSPMIKTEVKDLFFMIKERIR